MEEIFAATCIHEIFEAVARQQPRATAVVSPRGETTYVELDTRADRWARAMRASGVRSGGIVAIHLGRGLDALTAILATLKCGAAYAPLDPLLPVARAQALLSLAQPQHVVTAAENAAFAVDSAKVIGLTTLDSGSGREAETRDVARVDGDALAYVIFTSGTTGAPKCVAVRHSGVLNMARAQRRVFGIDIRSRVLQFFSFSFDASVFEIFMALLNGGALVMPDRDTLMDGSRLEQLIRDAGVTTLQLPPAVLAQLSNENVPSVETVFVGGETYPAQTIARWAKTHRVVNVYGPTEATVWATWSDLGRESASLDVAVIGRPIENVGAYVLDDDLRPAAAGEVGELYIGGAGVAAGYLNQPMLTDERFLPDPFAGDGARMYRTGDLASVLPDGALRFHGRRDRQVKVRGFRVEPSEIELCLAGHPAVREAAVAPLVDAEQCEGMIAFVVTSHATRDLPAELRVYAAARLPDYMIPSVIRLVDALPRTQSGKIDYPALMSSPAGRADEPQARLQPRNGLERVVAAQWEEVLGHAPASLGQKFLEAGGHSLAAVRLIGRLRQTLGVTLTLGETLADGSFNGICRALARRALARIALEPPSSSALREASPPAVAAPIMREWSLDEAYAALDEQGRCAAVAMLAGANVFGDGVELGAESVRGYGPLAPMQRRLLRLAQMMPESRAYTIGYRMIVRGPCRIDLLARAAAAALNRQAVSRATIVGDELSIQDTPIVVERIDFAASNAARAVEAFRRDALSQPIDLGGRLFRACLLVIDQDECELFFIAHHIMFDGWSVGVLSDDIGAAYSALEAGEAPDFPSLPFSYLDYARESEAFLASDEALGLKAYWAQKLSGDFATLRFCGRPASRERTDRPARRVALRLDGEIGSRIRALAFAFAVTPCAILLAAYAVLLRRYRGAESQGDLLIGAIAAGRSDPRTEQLVGFFVNTLPLRIAIAPTHSFRDVARAAFAELAAAQDHQALPYDDILSATLLEGRAPPVQAVFVYQNAPMHPPALRNAIVTIQEMPTEIAKFDIHLELHEKGSEYEGWFEIPLELMDETAADRLVADYLALCANACARPDQPLQALLPQAGPASIGETRNWDGAGFVHEMVVAQAARTPEAIAVTFEGRSLSYGELEQQSRRLALRLRAMGAGAGEVVAVKLERSIELVVALLAILRAGAAYVPFDPDHPANRRAAMLADCDPVAIISTQALIDEVDTAACAVLVIEDRAATDDAADSIALEVASKGADLAYVIFTSGSTGLPKGAMNTHAGLRNRLLWMQRRYALSATEDIVLQKTPYTFDVSVWEFFWPLIVGARLVLARPGGHQDHAYLARLMAAERVTTTHFVPSVLRLFLDEPGIRGRLDGLRRVICSGEELARDLAQHFFAALPSVELHNLYGPSEAAIDVSSYQCRPDDLSDKIPIGKAIDNIRLYLLDDDFQPTPAGIAGQIHIAGVGVGAGYVARPDLTNASFVDDPFSRERDARMYRTGDLAYARADGELVFLGRADAQVKLRGQRIELGEIETALRRDPRVRDTAVALTDVGSETARLCAYFVARPGEATPTPSSLAARLRETLPNYMIPSSFHIVEALPYTSSGKIDRKKLASPERSESSSSSAHDNGPVAGVEGGVRAVWQELFGTRDVGADSDFFELGGNSLLATRMVLKLREAFGVELPVRSLFEFSTVAGVSRAIEALTSPGGAGGSFEERDLDLEADAKLPDDVAPFEPYRPRPLRRALVTGATGFLGAFLLRELLASNDVELFCLVRASDAAAAFSRVRATMTKYGVWEQRFEERLKALAGDIALPEFGLPRETYDMLSREMDAIYHCGAWVNFIEPYRRLRGPNVRSVEEALRLACRGRTKPLHLVSSSSVFGTIGFAKGIRRIAEDDDIRMALGCHYGGYVKTKWAAEWLARQATARGAPVVIYRCGLILGDSESGVTNVKDFPSLLVKGCLQLGATYKLRNKLDNFVPVDYAARAIVRLSRDPQSLGRAFHIVNPHHIDYSDFWRLVGEEGYALRELEYDAWVEAMLSDRHRRDANALYPLLPLFIEKLRPTGLSVVELFQDAPIFCTEETEAALRGSDVVCPPIDRKLVSAWIGYYRRSGFIAPPAAEGRLTAS